MVDIVVVGSCVQDLISYTPTFPRPGESVRGHRFQMGFGGKGANQAVMAAKLGASVAFVGKVGDDMFGPSTIENFKAHNINTDFVQITKEASTATATITVADSGENSIVVVLGANECLSTADIDRAEHLIKSAKVVVCQLEIRPEVCVHAFKLARKHGVTTLFNPAPGLRNLPAELISLSDIICPNENEAEFISGMELKSPEDENRILDYLIEQGPKIAVITLGSRGCVYRTADCPTPGIIHADKVKAVDTTGAGDAFIGSLAYYLTKHESLSLLEKLHHSGEIAAWSVQRPGTQTSFPSRSELNDYLFA